MKLLIAVDFSPSSEAVITEIESRPWPDGTEAIVLNVIDVMGLGSGVMDLGSVIEEQREQARQLVDSIAGRLSSAGVRATGDVIDATPSSAIPAYGKQCGADFIILGSHGHGGLVRFLLGSVAKAVLRSAPCSVEIVRGGTYDVGLTKNMRILLASDGSQYSQAAARSVAARPWRADTEFRVVCFAELPPFCLPPHPGPVEDDTLEALRQGIMQNAEEAVESARAILRRAGLESAGEVAVGDPRIGILDEASYWGAWLIVLGSHGTKGAEGVAPGHVAETVALHSHCSVEVIRSELK